MMSERSGGSYKKITSVSNPLVKQIRSLHQKKFRDASGLFLAEGHKLAHDGLDAGWALQTLVFGTQSINEQPVATLAARAKASGAQLLEVSRQGLEKISRRDNPQAVIGVFKKQFGSLRDVGRDGLWVALDRVRDPGNLGTILRTCDATSVRGIALVGETCDPFSVEAVRATMGSLFHVPVIRCTEAAFIDHVKTAPATVIGTHLDASEDYRGQAYRQPLILLMGNEQQGLSQALAMVCDRSVRIPMIGRADSLNLAVSTGLMIYEALRDSLPTG